MKCSPFLVASSLFCSVGLLQGASADTTAINCVPVTDSHINYSNLSYDAKLNQFKGTIKSTFPKFDNFDENFTLKCHASKDGNGSVVCEGFVFDLSKVKHYDIDKVLQYGFVKIQGTFKKNKDSSVNFDTKLKVYLDPVYSSIYPDASEFEQYLHNSLISAIPDLEMQFTCS